MLSLKFILLESLLNEDYESLRVIDQYIRAPKYNPLDRATYNSLVDEFTDPDTSEDRKDEVKEKIKNASWRTVWTLAKQFGNVGADSAAPDLFQDGLSYLDVLFDRFDFSNKTATFNTFVQGAMRNHFINLTNKERKIKQKYTSINQPAGGDDDDAQSVADTSLDFSTPEFDTNNSQDSKFYLDKMKSYIRDIKDPEIKKLAGAVFTFMTDERYQKVKVTNSEIATALGKSQEWVRKAKAIIEAKLKEIINKG
jgi:RNA polymerase sigma factor (sigma-70 family)